MAKKKVTPKVTTVELAVEGKEGRATFEIAHAERILRMERNGGWHLPEDSKFTFDLKDGIRVKRAQD